MTGDRYDALVARLECLAETDPAAYRLRVWGVVVLGYLVILVMALTGLALAAAAAALLVWAFRQHRVEGGLVKLGGALGAVGIGLAWMAVRGALVRLPAPRGIVLARHEAPDLVAEVEHLRLAVGAPPVHRIVIDDGVNAMLVQRPLLGLFGWYRTYLVLGLPLLRQLSVAEARSVIGHELGHLRGHDGRTAVFIHRLRRTWTSIAAAGQGNLRWFLDRYVPWFQAHTLVLARQQERNADRIAATIAGPDAAAGALVRAVVLDHLARRFAVDLEREARTRDTMPSRPMDALDAALSQADVRSSRWIACEMRRNNRRDDPHPCLRERLAALGRATPPALAIVGAGNAAQHWLRGSLDGLVRRCDEQWRSEHVVWWHGAHAEGDEMRRELESFAGRHGDLSQEEQWRMVWIAVALEGLPTARPGLERFLSLHPDHAQALFHLGRHLVVDDRDPRGVPLLEAVMRLDPESILTVSAILHDFADVRGDAEGQRRIEQEAERRAALLSAAVVERERIPTAKDLRPHDRPVADLEAVRGILAGHAEVSQAHLAAVAVTHLPEDPYLVLVLTIPRRWWRMRDGPDQILAARIGVVLRMAGIRGTWRVIPRKGSMSSLAKAVVRLEGSLLYTA